MKGMMRFSVVGAWICGLLLSVNAETIPGRWTAEKANAWYQQKGWLVGCNFSPSTAINQLEMWQADSFDAKTIDRELDWAAGLGFNSIRVFLHDIVWKQDSKAMLARMEEFLKLADKHKIGVMFVIFDSCWDPYPKAGKQRDPKPHLHNSGWVQSPGRQILEDWARIDELEGYVMGVMGHFKNDTRIHAWDLFNEPDNPNTSSYSNDETKNKSALSLALLKKVFAWAREVNPSQPITAAPWRDDWSSDDKLSEQDKFLFGESDVISFHCYGNAEDMTKRIGWLKRFGRPLLCSEYMARPVGSTFETILPILKAEKVAAYNWGFVDGKTQTIYPWDSWTKTYNAEPPVWFHDIFRRDGKPYRPEEVALIRELTKKQ